MNKKNKVDGSGNMGVDADAVESEKVMRDIEKNGGYVVRTLNIQRRDVERMNLAPYLVPLKLILSDRDAVIRRRQDVRLSISGYGSDPRELCQIPEVRAFVKRMDQEFPYWFYFVDPNCGFLNVLLGCHFPLSEVNHSADGSKAGISVLSVDIVSFLKKNFHPLNAILDHFHLDDENDTINKQIVGSIMQSFTIIPQGDSHGQI